MNKSILICITVLAGVAMAHAQDTEVIRVAEAQIDGLDRDRQKFELRTLADRGEMTNYKIDSIMELGLTGIIAYYAKVFKALKKGVPQLLKTPGFYVIITPTGYSLYKLGRDLWNDSEHTGHVMGIVEEQEFLRRHIAQVRKAAVVAAADTPEQAELVDVSELPYAMFPEKYEGGHGKPGVGRIEIDGIAVNSPAMPDQECEHDEL